MKRGLLFGLLVVSVLITLSLTFISAGFFGEVFGKITGEQIKGSFDTNIEEFIGCPFVSCAPPSDGCYYDYSDDTVDENGCSKFPCGVSICEEERSICTDTDGGINTDVFGAAANDQREIFDSCDSFNNNYIYEAYCNNGFPTQQRYLCENGCVNGACVREEKIACTETDGGRDYYVRGSITIPFVGGREFVEDFCTDNSVTWEESDSGKYVIEVSCNSAELYECPNGCVEGACIKEPPYSYGLVTVTSPNGYEKIIKGSTQVISWTSSGFGPNAWAQIQLRDASNISKMVSLITRSVDSTGQYKWAVSSTIPDGKYLIWISMGSGYDGENNKYVLGSDYSDASFSIVAGNSFVCTDSDRGINYGQKGITDGYRYQSANGVRLVERTETDSCIENQLGVLNFTSKGPYLWESSCGPWNPGTPDADLRNIFVLSEVYECPNGCVDGACVGEEKIVCTDTDGGINYNLQGKVINFLKEATLKLPISGDTSSTSTTFLGGHTIKLINGDNTFVYLSVDGGEIVSIKEGTFKSVGPIEIKLKSVVSSDVEGVTANLLFGIFDTDVCTDLKSVEESHEGYNIVERGEIIREYYCAEPNYQWTFYKCPKGCFEGACIGEKSDNNFTVVGDCSVDAVKCNLEWTEPTCGTLTLLTALNKTVCEIPGIREGVISAGFSILNEGCSTVDICENGCFEGACRTGNQTSIGNKTTFGNQTNSTTFGNQTNSRNSVYGRFIGWFRNFFG